MSAGCMIHATCVDAREQLHVMFLSNIYVDFQDQTEVSRLEQQAPLPADSSYRPQNVL